MHVIFKIHVTGDLILKFSIQFFNLVKYNYVKDKTRAKDFKDNFAIKNK